MENKLLKTKRKRFIAFILDMIFTMLFAFSLFGLLGTVFKLDSEIYQNVMTYVLLLLVMPYIFFGEFIFKNTLGKYLLGIEVVNNEDFGRPSVWSFVKRGLIKLIWPVEGLVLLFTKSKKRLGDRWGKTIVVNKTKNQHKPLIRLAMGVVILVILNFSFSRCMGLGVKNTNFYAVGLEFLKAQDIAVTGLTREVNQNVDIVNYVMPIDSDNEKEYALIYLERIDGTWNVYHHELLEKHNGRIFNFTLSSSLKKEYHENGKLSFEGSLIGGQKAGTCKWYFDNGQIKELTIWHAGSKIGKVLHYHSNGQKAVEAFASSNGVKEGKATLWHENGQVSEYLYYSNNMITGSYLSYHPNGQLHEKGTYENSIRVGNWEIYDENGNEMRIK
ncbi:MAG: RDD family protein [Flavobacteriaceae bacterium]|nr:RDD family protein [Flavobacteriaceae bacterium]